MVAEDFLQDPQVWQWLDGIEPAWTLLTFDGLRALRQEPSAGQTAIRIANDLSADEITCVYRKRGGYLDQRLTNDTAQPNKNKRHQT